MTYGQEKSDLFIVAMKPANKPGRLGAEPADPRERTEGNTGEQHTRRTLRRGSVSERLDRVRGAACVSFFVSHPRVGARCEMWSCHLCGFALVSSVQSRAEKQL